MASQRVAAFALLDETDQRVDHHRQEDYRTSTQKPSSAVTREANSIMRSSARSAAGSPWRFGAGNRSRAARRRAALVRIQAAEL